MRVYADDDAQARWMASSAGLGGPPDPTGQRAYIDYVYGGLVADTPQVHKALADQVAWASSARRA